MKRNTGWEVRGLPTVCVYCTVQYSTVQYGTVQYVYTYPRLVTFHTEWRENIEDQR